MANLAVLLFALAVSFGAKANNEVCLLIDQMETGNTKYPNQARVVADRNRLFYVYHMKEACFDLEEEYYMQYFLWADKNSVIYATKCLYRPHVSHEGKILRFEGNSSATPCPIVEKRN